MLKIQEEEEKKRRVGVILSKLRRKGESEKSPKSSEKNIQLK